MVSLVNKTKTSLPPKGLIISLIILIVMSFVMYQVTDSMARQLFAEKMDDKGVVSYTYKVNLADLVANRGSPD